MSDLSPATHISYPLTILVSAFVTGMIGLGAWLLSLERKKLDKTDFSRYTSTIESRFTAMHSEIIQEFRELRARVRHVDDCPYLRDIQRRADE